MYFQMLNSCLASHKKTSSIDPAGRFRQTMHRTMSSGLNRRKKRNPPTSSLLTLTGTIITWPCVFILNCDSVGTCGMCLCERARTTQPAFVSCALVKVASINYLNSSLSELWTRASLLFENVLQCWIFYI